MGIVPDPTPAAKQWGGAARPAIEAVTKLIGQSYVEAGFKLHDAVKAVRAAEGTVEQRAWTLWQDSQALALGEFFKTTSLTRQPDDAGELRRLLDEILEGSAAIVAKERVELTAADLKKPTGFRLYREVREKLPEWARKVAPEHLRDEVFLRRRLDRAFIRGFHRARFEGGDHFAPVKTVLSGEGSEGIQREDLWLRYYEWLRAEVEDRPLFGQDDGGPSLADIFVPLRCSWRTAAATRRGGDKDEEETRTTVHVRWLKDALDGWLKAGDKQDTLRVVTGGPGCGKSSSAMMYAHDVAAADHVNVFVVPLQGLDVRAGIEDIVQSHVTTASRGGVCLPQSPIDWLASDPKPLLLVFDGLDEVARPDGAGLEVTRQFLGNLRTWLTNVNNAAQGEAKVLALALGRPQAAAEAAREIALSEAIIIRVEPLCRLGDERLLEGLQGCGVIEAPDGLCDEDQRRGFWDRYAQFDRECAEDDPAALADDDFEELTIEPLLLYLLIFSRYAGKKWLEAKENRNRVYKAIFEEVHKRDVEKGGYLAKEGLTDPKDFFRLMECLGLAAWLGGGRTGRSEDFEIVRDRIYLPEHAERFRNLISAGLKNVALQFFAHQGASDEPGYAFIHKSFGEYLTARALIEAGDKWCKRYEGLPADFAKAWLQLTGEQRQTRDLTKFLVDEARLRMKPRRDSDLDWKAARERVICLAKVASETLRHGFPAHGALDLVRAPTSWRGCEHLQRNAEEGLYDLMSAWAESGYPITLLNAEPDEGGWQPGAIKVTLPDDAAIIGILRRLDDYQAGQRSLTINLTGWDLSEQRMNAFDLRPLTLNGAHLIEANLNGADLIEANLFGAHLIGADLRGAILFGANLIGAHLGGADLSGADLSGADLSGADLSGADLSGADLSGADLSGADLSGADLSGADLSGAHLIGADCSRLNIDSAWLQSANLSGAVNLGQEQIDRAQGNSETELPSGMSRPAHWESD